MATQQRSRGFYVGVLALPIVMLLYFVASGGMAEWFGAGRGPRPSTSQDWSDFLTSLLWLGSLAPLGFAAWEIGREHTAARRLNYVVVIGLREVVRRALGLADEASEREREEEFARPPRDNPRIALVWGLAVALLVPTFFAWFGWKDLRTPRMLLWLSGAGMLMGAITYCRRRAMAYLVDEPPSRWEDPFREWRLLNPDRYAEQGRVFVRWQIAVLLLLPIWWLGGGMVLLSSH